MDERALALAYLPVLHMDCAETIPLRAIGYAVLAQSGPSPSFRRELIFPAGCRYVIEYQYYWDYDIQHMYDLEHIWVSVGMDGKVMQAEASFHGKYLFLYTPTLACADAPEDTHVHAYCQPGKHAFLPRGDLFALLPDWRMSCTSQSGGGVLVGGPFAGRYSSTSEEDELSCRHLRSKLSFQPTLVFQILPADEALLMPWAELYAAIPGWIAAECARLKQEERA